MRRLVDRPKKVLSFRGKELADMSREELMLIIDEVVEMANVAQSEQLKTLEKVKQWK